MLEEGTFAPAQRVTCLESTGDTPIFDLGAVLSDGCGEYIHLQPPSIDPSSPKSQGGEALSSSAVVQAPTTLVRSRSICFL
ncbi:hypothetical protein CVT26_004875 [Gymnopilus dilepis]|uniref:Uncharacterized protein n=1 Tax=Gymnopilus dilepis TaxID=231916 RepID=A0A409W8H2_9AGAR|nr:hypothetical protein CVT26_004875 [Gymnopilus dilepis]